MTIDEATESLKQKLGEPDVFTVQHDSATITVHVNFIYRVDDVKAYGDTYEGFPLRVGRRSCW
jgi:hypothetical protein